MASFYATLVSTWCGTTAVSWMLVVSVKGKQQNVNDESTEYLHATYMYKHYAECYSICDCMQKQVMSWLFT